jgi:hypothetical protein
MIVELSLLFKAKNKATFLFCQTGSFIRARICILIEGDAGIGEKELGGAINCN